MGVEILAPYDTDKIRANKTMGNFNLQAFRVPHGEEINYGLLIRHKNCETLLFITDYSYTEFLFKACKVNHFLIECNWQKEYVDMDSENFRHKIKDHCSLDTCKKFISENMTAYTRSVILCHLGQGSTNPKECVTEVKSIVGDKVSVDYARANTIYELGVKENADIH